MLIKMRYQVLEPFVREGLPERPLFLIVLKGMHRLVGKKKLRYKHRGPSFSLISALQTATGKWQLPLPITTILTWLWQRCEIEVSHREMKSGLGLGEKQCWNKRSSVVRYNGAPGLMLFCYWLIIAPGVCVTVIRPPPAGGRVQNVGRSIPSGVPTTQSCGINAIFDPFGPQPAITDEKNWLAALDNSVSAAARI
jgi:hypothetical protein